MNFPKVLLRAGVSKGSAVLLLLFGVVIVVLLLARATYDWWLVSLTGVLTLYTGLLYTATVTLAEEGKLSGESQIKALKAIERAYVFVEISFDGTLRSSPFGFPDEMYVKFWNYGKTPAQIDQIRAVTATLSEVPQVLPPIGDSPLPPALGIPQNVAYDVSVIVRLSDMEKAAVERMDKSLYCMGLITYRDIFGTRQETGFCWNLLYHMQRAVFIPTRSSSLNKRT